MRTQWIVPCVIVSGLLALTSALAWAKDEGSVKDVLGTYSTTVNALPEAVTKAARKVVEDMKFTNIDSKSTDVDGKVTAKTADDKEVTINIEKTGDKASRVSVRVGMTGDEAISKEILEKIKVKL